MAGSKGARPERPRAAHQVRAGRRKRKKEAAARGADGAQDGGRSAVEEQWRRRRSGGAEGDGARACSKTWTAKGLRLFCSAGPETALRVSALQRQPPGHQRLARLCAVLLRRACAIGCAQLAVLLPVLFPRLQLSHKPCFDQNGSVFRIRARARQGASKPEKHMGEVNKEGESGYRCWVQRRGGFAGCVRCSR
eukprot:3823185-Rhodomonas_salina.2